MNVAGIKPARRVLMVGAGNIGLIVSYQLKQAGVDVAAVIEGLPKIGGYLVHASKIRRAGIPVLTRHTILEAYGNGQVEGAIIARIDEKWQPVPGTQQDILCDTICLAVGLSPLTELAWQAGCEMAYIRELSGHVPIVNEYLETTCPGIYSAGDACGIEEASSAMVEGRLAGISAPAGLGYGNDITAKLQKEAIEELKELRAGPTGKHIRTGLEKVSTALREQWNV
jgi:sarcosine oxidase subunit alpha